MKVKYWLGCLESKSISIWSWLSAWKESISDAEKENMTIVAFKIPNQKSGRMDTLMIAEIEKMLQEKFGE